MGADDVAERSLSGSVGADQGNELAFRNGQVDIVDSVRVAEIFLQVNRLKEGHFVHLPSFAGEPRGRADDASRQHHDQNDQHTPSRSLPIFGAGDRVGLEIVERYRADDRTGEVAESAQHGHEHDLAGERPIENVGRGETVERHPQDRRQVP